VKNVRCKEYVYGQRQRRDGDRNTFVLGGLFLFFAFAFFFFELFFFFATFFLLAFAYVGVFVSSRDRELAVLSLWMMCEWQ
jgi:hypothetical protein